MGSNQYYVLCLNLTDMMIKNIGVNRLLHKDLNGITINGTKYNLTVKDDNSGFNPPNTPFIASGSVNRLASTPEHPNPDPVPAGTWVLYFKTDVPVGGPQTAFDISFTDKKGLSSGIYTASTHMNRPKEPKLSYKLSPPDTPTEITYNQAGESSPYTIDCSTLYAAVENVSIDIKTETTGAKVHAELYKKNGSAYDSVSPDNPSNSLTQLLPLPAFGGEITYKLTVWAGGQGFTATPKKDYYIKLTRKTEVTGGSEAWKKLKNLVAKVPEGTTIIVNGTIKATNAYDNSGTITIDKNLTIKGKNSGTLDANGSQITTDIFFIFEVASDKTLTLENLTLTNANKGAIFVAQNGNLALNSVTVKDCTTQYNAAGIYFMGKSLTVKDSKFEKCIGQGVSSAGAISIEGNVSNKAHVTIQRTTFTENKTTATDSSGGAIHVFSADCTLAGVEINACSAKKAGGGIHIASGGTVTLTENNDGQGHVSCIISDCTAQNGGGVYVTGGTFIMSGGSRITPSADPDANTPGKNDVYLETGSTVMINGPLTGLSPIARITPSEYTEDRQVIGIDPAVTQDPEAVKALFTLTLKYGLSLTERFILINNPDDTRSIIIKKAQVVSAGGTNPWTGVKNAIAHAGDGAHVLITGTITASASDDGVINIKKDITLEGDGTGAGFDADNLNRIFKVDSYKKLTLKNLTLKNGKDTTAANIVGAGGGGIYAEATSRIELTDVTIENCQSGGIGAGIHIDFEWPGGGSLMMKNTRIRNNTVDPSGYSGDDISGGGISLPNNPYTAIIDGCTISGNKINLHNMSGSGMVNVKGCALTNGNKKQSLLTIKGHTVIKNNTYIPHASRPAKCTGMALWAQGGTIIIGEDNKPDAESPLIQGHTAPVGAPAGSTAQGNALYLEGSAEAQWKSGVITGNGGADVALFLEGSESELTNDSGNTAD